MPQFAADHFVAAAGIAGDVDTAHIDPPPRVDHYRKSDTLCGLVQLGDRVGVGKSITLVAQPVGDFFGALVEFLAREGLARLQLDQPAQFGFRQQQLAAELDIGHGVLFALGDIDRDVDVFLVRRDRYLRRIYIELEITVVEVIGTQGLQVAGQFLLGILVVLGVPGQPPRGLQHEQLQQVLFLVRVVTDDIDLVDLGYIAFIDGKTDADAIAFEGRNRGNHAGAVAPA